VKPKCTDENGVHVEKFLSFISISLCVAHLIHKDTDVIELSSGDEDALQISSESADEEVEGGGTEESSGAHVNDALNQPDTQGRVLVNINHPADEEDLYLAPQLARAVKPHQVCTLMIIWHTHYFSLSLFLSCHVSAKSTQNIRNLSRTEKFL